MDGNLRTAGCIDMNTETVLTFPSGVVSNICMEPKIEEWLMLILWTAWPSEGAGGSARIMFVFEISRLFLVV